MAEQPLLDDSFPLPTSAPFTTGQAFSAGLTARNLRSLVDVGLLRRPVRGVYLACQAGDSPALRAACIRLVVPDGAVVCDRHAGWLHGATMVLAPNEHLELRPVSVFRLRGMGRLRNDLSASGERDLRPDDIEELRRAARDVGPAHGLRPRPPALPGGRHRRPRLDAAPGSVHARRGRLLRPGRPLPPSAMGDPTEGSWPRWRTRGRPRPASPC